MHITCAAPCGRAAIRWLVRRVKDILWQSVILVKIRKTGRCRVRYCGKYPIMALSGRYCKSGVQIVNQDGFACGLFSVKNNDCKRLQKFP